MKLLVQIICAIALLVLIVDSVSAQKPNCWEYYKEDPDTIDQVYFAYKGNCNFYYQCTAHGAMRMKCPPNMHFDTETNQCGRPDDVNC